MSAKHEMLDLAERVVARGRALGAEEVNCVVSGGTQVSITRREGKVEQATEATSRGLALSLLLDQRFSSHSTSDLRPDALDAFLQRAIAATKHLEPDEYRGQADVALCGRGVSEAQLDQDDPSWYQRSATDRASAAKDLEDALIAHNADDVISSAVYVAEGCSESFRVMSNGFSGATRGAWYARGGEMALDEGNGKRPESAAYYGGRYQEDLPDYEYIAAEVVRRARERLNSGPIESGEYTMVLPNRAAGRILGAFGGPLSGGSIHQKRSCMEGKLGTRVGSDLFTIHDDPTISRGLGSRPWDGDAMRAKPRTIVENGILKQYNIGVYYGRKLGMEPTSGGQSNWLIPGGSVPTADMLGAIDKAIMVTGFLGGNSNGTTGDFSFGIRGVLLEKGEPVKSLSEMNVTGNVASIFEQLVSVGDDPWMYSSVRSPTLVFEDVQFSGT
jgi:PmbA protein